MWCLKVVTGMVGSVIGMTAAAASKIGGLVNASPRKSVSAAEKPDLTSGKVQKEPLKENRRKGATGDMDTIAAEEVNASPRKSVSAAEKPDLTSGKVHRKLSKGSERKDISDDMDTSAAGVIIASGAATIATLYAKPEAAGSGEHMTEQVVDIKSKGRIPESVLKNAEETVGYIKKAKPDVQRIAVDGLPGSGKGQLARAIAQKLEFAWECMEGMEADAPMNFRKPTTVYEYHRLLRTQNCDNFDAIVYVNEPIEVATERISKRKQGPAILETLDFDKLKLVGDKAFEVCSGDPYNVPDTNIHIKIQPEEGFGAEENITVELAGHGIAARGMDKEQMLFLCADGKAREGLTAYAHAGEHNKKSLLKLAEGMRNVK